jgi:ammonium transporter Rh
MASGEAYPAAVEMSPPEKSVFVLSKPKESASAVLVSQLLDAASRGNTHLIDSLLQNHQGENLHASSADYDKRTALHLAASEGLLDCVKFLVEKKADINTKDRWNGTPLDDAVRQRHDAVVEYLVANGAVPGDDKEAASRLLAAVDRNDLEAVEGLIKSGVPATTADYDKRTALHIAVGKANAAMIKFLVDKGADLNAVDAFGLSPLAEAGRCGTRTGENKVRDLLISLGAVTGPKKDGAADGREASRLFVWVALILQVLFIILFGAFTKFHTSADTSGTSSRLAEYYGMYMDVHVMIIVGFGFLMTFLRKYGYSSVGFNFLIAALVMQWHILCGGFVHQIFAGSFHKIEVDVTSLLLADFAAASVLITFGALLGKVTPLQLLCVGFFEIIFFAINENILVGSIGIVDVGGSIIVHVFGAYFGLAASKLITPKHAMDDSNNAANYHSDMFAMIGTTFLWIYWPSFVAAPAGVHDREMAVISTLLSLTGSCVAAFFFSHLFRERQFCMVDVQNATLAGGVAIGTIANMAPQSPAIAIATGSVSGVLSVVGYTKVQPFLQKTIGLHDTCGVNNLHGMPGIMSGLLSVLFAGIATTSAFTGNPHLMAVYGSRFDDSGAQIRSSGEQAAAQLGGLACSFALALVFGAITGALAKCVGRLERRSDDYFLDSTAWEVPELETPFYFDKRGEINRDLLKDLSKKGSEQA